MSRTGPKQQVFAGLAQIAHALAHAHRLELLEHLGQGERSVEDLATRASLTLANASRHLQLLRRAALVEGRREGKRVYYRLAGDEVVVGLLAALSRVGERNSAEIARVITGIFARATSSSRYPATSCSTACAAGLRPFSTSGRRTSLQAGICPML
jgi:DNA-binding transcriptional ArsR family regulator